MGTVVAAAAVVDAVGDVEGALEPYRTVDAVEGVVEPNRTVGGEGEGAVEGEGDVEEGVGEVEGAVAELEELAVAGLVAASAWIFGQSSGNCKVAPFLPSLTAIGYYFCRALWRSADCDIPFSLPPSISFISPIDFCNFSESHSAQMGGARGALGAASLGPPCGRGSWP